MISTIACLRCEALPGRETPMAQVLVTESVLRRGWWCLECLAAEFNNRRESE